jgi:hypothetical protein
VVVHSGDAKPFAQLHKRALASKLLVPIAPLVSSLLSCLSMRVACPGWE